jgi:anti-sigma regulatory factor (Ser/Thr protein kinase)
MERSDRFASCAESIGAARHLVRTTLGEAGRHDLVDRAALAVSELATNAMLYGAGDSFGVELTVDPRWVSVTVVDASAIIPVRRHDVAPGAVGGRGLAMVEALADAWGVVPFDGGKRVWARFGELS